MDLVYIALIAGFFAASASLNLFLRGAVDKGGRPCSWAYWLSGLAALGVFMYLVVALFRPELFSLMALRGGCRWSCTSRCFCCW